jgi:hypothetical protein
MHITPVTWEAEVRGSQSEVDPEKNARLCLKNNNIKSKGLAHGLLFLSKIGELGSRAPA